MPKEIEGNTWRNPPEPSANHSDIDDWFRRQPAEAQRDALKRMEAMLDREGVAYDFVGHRDAPPGLRLWCGATIETSDVEAVLPWLDWAYGEIRRAAAA